MEYGSVADEFFVNLSLQTTLALPNTRETVLHFFEAVQKQFSSMTNFYQREGDRFVLEADREADTYMWLELQPHNLSAGYFNPPAIENAYELHRWLLDRSVYYLGASALDVESLDVLFGFNLEFAGNRDAVVAQAVFSGSPMGDLFVGEPAKMIECEPSFVVALDEGCYMQARLHVETHSSTYQVRTGQFHDEPIGIYLTVRQYPRPGAVLDIKTAFARQCEACEDIISRIVLPNVMQAIAAAIAASQ
ncbi:MAG: hypothetical protein ACYTF6_02130 [Planctomycetota bacterium]|jgi:hypothetical protein